MDLGRPPKNPIQDGKLNLSDSNKKDLIEYLKGI